MKTFNFGIILSLILMSVFIFGCKNNTSNSNKTEFDYLNIGTLKLMKENLKSATSDFDTFCYDDDQRNCDSIGTIYNWAVKDSICPKGWHLPTTSDLLALIEHIPGKVNANNGKLMSPHTADFLNIRFGGGKIKNNELGRYYGKGSQEIWLVSSDSIWTDSNNSDKKYYLTALHIYSNSKDSINIEPTFSDNPTDFYGYCRCIKDTIANKVYN